MSQPDMTTLTREEFVDGRGFVYVRPGLVATYYVAGPVDQANRTIAAAIPRYLEFVGLDAIKCYLASDGTYKAFSQRRLARDIKIMSSATSAERGPSLEYSSACNSGVGAFGISIRGDDNIPNVPRSVTLLRFEFPEDALERYGVDGFLDFVTAEAARLRAQSSTVGWGTKRAIAWEPQATAAINTILPRYLGLDPCYNRFARYMRDRTPWAQWIIAVSADLFAACGEEKRLREVGPSVPYEVTRDGMAIIRGAKLPPIGDVNRTAKDLGCLPDVARFLKPLRVTISALGDRIFDASSWLARFDELPSRQWDNE